LFSQEKGNGGNVNFVGRGEEGSFNVFGQTKKEPLILSPLTEKEDGSPNGPGRKDVATTVWSLGEGK